MMRLRSEARGQALVPQVQLLEADLHPSPRFPLRLPAAPGCVADVEILQPGGQGMLTTGTSQTIGEQREHALGQRLVVTQGRRAGTIQDRPRPNSVNKWRAARTGPQVQA